jgi:hypothetical protein
MPILGDPRQPKKRHSPLWIDVLALASLPLMAVTVWHFWWSHLPPSVFWRNVAIITGVVLLASWKAWYNSRHCRGK